MLPTLPTIGEGATSFSVIFCPQIRSKKSHEMSHEHKTPWTKADEWNETYEIIPHCLHFLVRHAHSI